MLARRSSVDRALIATTLVIGGAGGVGCSLAPEGPIPPTRITKLQAYSCAVRNATLCLARGNPIPPETLPPTSEAFQVWVWHPGSNTTEWRLLSSLDSITVPNKLGIDSAAESFILNGAPAKKYTVRVLIKGVSGYLAEDSLHWEFP